MVDGPGNKMEAARTREVHTELWSFSLGFTIDAW
jgi:hypothetical protein